MTNREGNLKRISIDLARRLELLKSPHQMRIEAFMRKAEGLAPGKQGIPERPMAPSAEVRLLRALLIMEEAIETVSALGVRMHIRSEDSFFVEALDELTDISFSLALTYGPDLAAIADGCADLSVVTIGTLSACGLPDEPILEAVDANNLAKFGPGVSVDAAGKLVKPPNHQPPDLAGLIRTLESL